MKMTLRRASTRSAVPRPEPTLRSRSHTISPIQYETVPILVGIGHRFCNVEAVFTPSSRRVIPRLSRAQPNLPWSV